MTSWTPLKVRRALRNTFGPFFVTHGQLNPTQLVALTPLLDGRDLLLCSPTASGKTAAAIAPLLERHAVPGDTALRVLYVVPTRALVNDLYRRLEGPLRDLRLPLVARTGDKQPLRTNQTAAVLLTTPESLDSLLCRQPERFSELGAIVLDEVHLVDGTYRGDQVRVLLSRLPATSQRVALSATAAEPNAFVERYLSPNAEIVDIGERRELEFHAVSDPEDAVAVLRKHRRHKVLWFCETRQDVELVAERLQSVWPANRLVAHHGSLAKRQRESAEAAMRDWPWGLCVATMTMEIGIDIGDVDAIVLQHPPRTIASFQQRIGRGCRREHTMFAVGICDAPDDMETYRTYVEMTRAGQLEHEAYQPDLSVVAQQILSMLFAMPSGVELLAIQAHLSQLSEADTIHAIIEHLEAFEDGPFLFRRGMRIHATTRTMDLGEKGLLHSNIPSTGGKKFVDAASGKAIGRAMSDVKVGDMVVLAGQARRVTRVTSAAVQLEHAQGQAMKAPKFSRDSSAGAWRWLLPEELRRR